MNAPNGLTRRAFVGSCAAATVILVSPSARATPQAMADAIRAFTGGAEAKEGGVTIDIPLLLESGASVPTSVVAESPMTAQDHVTEIAVFNEKNPLPEVVTFHFTPRSGRAQAATRIRLNDSQTVVAIAKMSDGTFRRGSIDVIVTLPACAEML